MAADEPNMADWGVASTNWYTPPTPPTTDAESMGSDSWLEVAGTRSMGLRRKLRVLRTAAAPGPSSRRNALIQDIGELSGGIAAIAAWVTKLRRGRSGDSTIELWTAATISPVDTGWMAGSEEDGGQRLRKLRPIACAEA